ncbi:MAG: DUF3566 domain-containing protein [Actinomycetota bacterium]|nr:DUF3566 domain-containing protein [Actinomycetota bacterium]
MTQPPPYVGPAEAQTSQFGATTVSGTPVANGGMSATSPGTVPPRAGVPPVSSGGMPPNLVGAIPPPGPDGAKAAKAPRVRGPRRARLQLRHINPWTVLKFSCVLSVALFFVWLIVVGILFGVLNAAGVIQKINDTVVTINGSGSKAPISSGIVFGGAAIVGVVNVVLFIALTTVGSVIYNLCADLVGGVELTLSEA